MNNKGFTLIELIISIVLISIVIIFMYRLITDIKYEKDNPGYDKQDEITRADIIKTIETDIFNHGGIRLIQYLEGHVLNSTEKVTDYTLYFCDYLEENIEISNNTLEYNNRKWQLKNSNYKFYFYDGNLPYDSDNYSAGNWILKFNDGVNYLLIKVVDNDDNNDSTIDDIIIPFRIGQC